LWLVRMPFKSMRILLQLAAEVNKHVAKNSQAVFNLKTIRMFRQTYR